jgi:hypothetical protein
MFHCEIRKHVRDIDACVQAPSLHLNSCTARCPNSGPAVQALDAICNLHIEVELVTCMMLISTLGRNNAWVLAEATFMAFFRQSGHFNELEAIPKAATTHSAMQSVLRLSSQLPMGMDAYARSGMLLGYILEFVDVYTYAKYHRSAVRPGKNWNC